MVVNDPAAQGAKNFDDPFLDPKAQSRVGELIAAGRSERTGQLRRPGSMKIALNSFLFAAATSLALCCSGASLAYAQAVAPMAAGSQIYLLRGLFGVFSLGMDQLSAKLKEKGYETRLIGWEQWPLAANEILAGRRRGDRGPIILIGHSLGSNSTIQLATRIGQANIVVDLIVTFDRTQPLDVPNNVVHFINFYQKNGFGKAATPGQGFHGELNNIDLTASRDLDHVSIDKADRLQSIVIDKILEITDQQNQQSQQTQPRGRSMMQ